MNESNDCYPSVFTLKNFKLVDINIEDCCLSEQNSDISVIHNNSDSSDEDIRIHEDSDKDETDLEDEIRRSKYGDSGLTKNFIS